MKSFQQITEQILERIQKSGNNKFSLEDIQKIIDIRMFLLEEDMIEWFYRDDFEDEIVDKDDIEYKETVYGYIIDSCADDKLTVNSLDLDTIFRTEYQVLQNVIDLKTYYDILFNHPDMDFKREFTIDKWTSWTEKIDDAVNDFIEEFDLFPNILIANEHTFSQINFLINNIPGEKKNVFIYDEKSKKQVSAENTEFVYVDSYTCDDYTLIFTLNPDLEDKKFILDYDEDKLRDDDEDDDGDDDDKTPVEPIPVFERDLI